MHTAKSSIGFFFLSLSLSLSLSLRPAADGWNWLVVLAELASRTELEQKHFRLCKSVWISSQKAYRVSLSLGSIRKSSTQWMARRWISLISHFGGLRRTLVAVESIRCWIVRQPATIYEYLRFDLLDRLRGCLWRRQLFKLQNSDVGNWVLFSSILELAVHGGLSLLAASPDHFQQSKI